MQSLLRKRRLATFCIGLFIISSLVLASHNAGRVEGNPHEVWRLSDGFNNLRQVIRFLNDKHLHKFQIVKDNDGSLRVIYEH